MMREKGGLEDISYAPLQSAEEIIAQEQQNIQNLGQQIKITQSRIDSLQYQHSSNFEAETELKQFLKNYQIELEKKKNELAALEKKAKNAKSLAAERDKYEKKIQNLVQKIEKTKARIVTLQESQGDNSEKELDLLKKNYEEKKKELAALKDNERLKALVERERDLKLQNEEDQKIIQDENTSPSERQAAEGRVAERNEELDRLQTQIGEIESAMPLRERVREIFKKHGLTITAIVIAVGAIIGAITEALKSSGKAMGSDIYEIGSKLDSNPPGLIVSIVSYLFKTAGQAIGFLAEHAWLLILLAVFFIFEKLTQRHKQQSRDGNAANN